MLQSATLYDNITLILLQALNLIINKVLAIFLYYQNYVSFYGSCCNNDGKRF